jgi:hypothetical protein
MVEGWLENEVVTVSDMGTGQGRWHRHCSPNVFDLWAERWRRREALGDMIIVRYADDIIEYQTDARIVDYDLCRLGQSRGINVTGRGTDLASTANVPAIGILAQSPRRSRQYTSKTAAKSAEGPGVEHGTKRRTVSQWSSIITTRGANSHGADLHPTS